VHAISKGVASGRRSVAVVALVVVLQDEFSGDFCSEEQKHGESQATQQRRRRRPARHGRPRVRLPVLCRL